MNYKATFVFVSAISLLIAPTVGGQQSELLSRDSVQPSAVGTTLDGGTIEGSGPFAVPLCRLVDTPSEPPAERNTGSVRSVIVREHRCGWLVPPDAVAYELRVTTIGLDVTEPIPGSEPEEKIVVLPAIEPLEVPVTPGRSLEVDLAGYYLPPGESPPAATSGTSVLASDDLRAAAKSGGTIEGDAVVDGTAGDLILDASGYANSGVLFRSQASTPYVTARTGSATSDSGFAVYNSSDTEVFRMRSDGMLRLPPTGFLNGRTDYYGNWTYGAIPGNMVHNIAITNPMDAAGTNLERVVYFNAWSTESGSPPITKFQAYTQGYYSQLNINFDSRLHYHKPNNYHFRAFSTYEDKATFWVRAATDYSTIAQTRADMYVSGRIGIGTDAPPSRIAVSGAGALNSVAAAQVTLSNSTSGSGVTQHMGDTGTWQMVDSASGAPRLAIDSGGNIGIGTTSPGSKLDVSGDINASGRITAAQVINATYQDIAEWVPATENLMPGAVVVVDPRKHNHVVASSRKYDTSVAGVVSGQPGVVLGEEADHKRMIATFGRVRVRVDATEQPVSPGDLLVTSDRPGMAMKSIPVDINGVAMHRPGTLIGKALEPLESGEGDVLVLLSLQ